VERGKTEIGERCSEKKTKKALEAKGKKDGACPGGALRGRPIPAKKYGRLGGGDDPYTRYKKQCFGNHHFGGPGGWFLGCPPQLHWAGVRRGGGRGTGFPKGAKSGRPGPQTNCRHQQKKKTLLFSKREISAQRRKTTTGPCVVGCRFGGGKGGGHRHGRIPKWAAESDREKKKKYAGR